MGINVTRDCPGETREFSWKMQAERDTVQKKWQSPTISRNVLKDS